MSREKPNRSRGVQFTRESAEAIAAVVRTAGDAARHAPGMHNTHAPYASSHYLSKTTESWSKGTSQSLTLWIGDPGSEASNGETVTAWNKFATVASGKWVMLARCNGSFYLIAAEC